MHLEMPDVTESGQRYVDVGELRLTSQFQDGPGIAGLQVQRNSDVPGTGRAGETLTGSTSAEYQDATGDLMDQRLQFGIKQGIAGRDPIDTDRE